MGQQLTRVEATVEKLVNKLEQVIPRLQLFRGKSIVKQTDQVPIRSNLEIIGFKLKKADFVIGNVTFGVIEALSKQFKDYKLQTLDGQPSVAPSEVQSERGLHAFRCFI